MGLSRWEGILAKGEAVSVQVSTLPKEEQTLFALLGVKSGVVLPIFITDRPWGFIGFFDLHERTRSPDEIEALRITANLLGAAFGHG
jgi:GAF domain-containing protein